MSTKKIIILIASIVGIISIAMPWFSAMGQSINAINKYFSDGYFFAILFIVALVFAMIEKNKEFTKKTKLGILIPTSINLLFIIFDIFLNLKSAKKMPLISVSIGMGAVLCLLSAVVIIVSTLFLNSDANFENINTKSINTENIKETVSKGIQFTKSVAKVTTKSIKNVIDEAKKDMEENNKDK